ncbi:ethanolamine ammonia-lyase reactivating factor EutA [Vibrio sp. SCSIO 43137]|uniref:ethanolamine ammonia-lyase reactivating factor EutA n=1 Tax=Vibrio sp. SCSIO 43137 TaxID=3021011 RepID=UPI0023073C82|nr:ethanolamine ammonia-lyase reactivating factor EutA [Vibrio sp. SCSIO 43137]WCE28601.1 ethanolamine ammonia-lyase reactivating factor EutA [Vibrio sp. SCSIO 43137]
MNTKLITSVGIDVGTTTTQVIFSRLTLVNRAPASQVPVYEFIGREIIYQSPVVFTPIDFDGVIDNEKIQEFVQSQITAAGSKAEEVETGAIIITGETAKAQNARSSLLSLSQELGDFVVATAGPHLESIIAGRGSGAHLVSEANHSRVMNIDIGGGTANFVVFDCGRVVDTACINIGGRLIQLDDNGRVTYLSEAGAILVKEVFGEQISPNILTMDHVRRISQKMADILFGLIRGDNSQITARLLQTAELKEVNDIDAIYISGGVGNCLFQERVSPVAELSFGDMGPMLARSMLRHIEYPALPIKQPKQTVRATVIGAGAHSLSLSGSTIWLKVDSLPMKNIPVIHPAIDWNNPDFDVSSEICICAERMDIALATDQYAIALDSSMPTKYKAVLQAVKGLEQFYRLHGNHNDPAIVISHNDIGKALGMELQPLLLPQPLAVIDEVMTREGDYIDIGKSYFGGEIVPLTVKSLAFPS